jgi:hypothetical protein
MGEGEKILGLASPDFIYSHPPPFKVERGRSPLSNPLKQEEIPLNPPASAEAATRRQAFFKGGNWIPAFAGMAKGWGQGEKYIEVTPL